MDYKAITMKLNIIIGVLWIFAGVLMLINKKVSFGSIQIKLDGFGLYVIVVGIILIGIYMIYHGIKKMN